MGTDAVTGRVGGRLAYEAASKVFPGPAGSHRAIHALRDVDLRIEPGDAVGIIGPNGAGKSTILKLAAGISAPTSGRIVRTGRTVAVIELGAGMHPDLTGRENLDLLASLTMGPAERRVAKVDEIVEFAELTSVMDEPVRHYSTGMIARLAFSVAVHAAPQLLLIDEVLSVGDLSFQRRCRDRLFELRGSGTTIVLVSHDLGLVEDTCDRAVLLVDGAIERDGDTDEVVGHYLGRQRAPRTSEGLELRVERPTVDSGRPVVADLVVPEGVAASALRLDFVTPTHAALQGDQGPSIVCGSTVLPISSTGSMRVALHTLDLPPGRYELHAALEDPDRRILGAEAVPFSLVGPPGRAIRLRHTWAVERLGA